MASPARVLSPLGANSSAKIPCWPHSGRSSSSRRWIHFQSRRVLATSARHLLAFFPSKFRQLRLGRSLRTGPGAVRTSAVAPFDHLRPLQAFPRGPSAKRPGYAGSASASKCESGLADDWPQTVRCGPWRGARSARAGAPSHARQTHAVGYAAVKAISPTLSPDVPVEERLCAGLSAAFYWRNSSLLGPATRARSRRPVSEGRSTLSGLRST